MPPPEPRALHLHTLESLLADLVSGRALLLQSGTFFAVADDRARSALEWYRKKGAAAWTSAVTAPSAEDLVKSTLIPPPNLPELPARPANANARRLRLKKVVVHRFAGVHKFGTPDAPPPDYTHEFLAPVALFEGRNGAGKTSLLNAIIWALTGELLRPQREPEAPEDFECWVAPVNPNDEPTAHRLSSVTPMPHVEQYRPDQGWVPADTWVELTLVDQTGVELPVVRRSVTRSPQGKLRETPPDLTVLGVDPIAIRIGTVMPGLLPLIKVGSESELGHAVAQLTGLSALIDLADHVRRARAKIDTEFVKAREREREQSDENYRTAKTDLEKIVTTHPTLNPPLAVPQPSNDDTIEQVLVEITKHFEAKRAGAFESARGILGEKFDPSKPSLLADLEKNIDRALERVSQPQILPSAARLAALRKLTPEELAAADKKISNIVAEAKELDELARNPSEAARIRLYARVATWIADHPDPHRREDLCPLCMGDLTTAIDPITGRTVREHIHDAADDAVLLSQTMSRWAESAQGDLLRTLPEPLRAEAGTDLPRHPCDLLRAAIIDELFSFEPFRGVLGSLQSQTALAFDAVTQHRAALGEVRDINLPPACGLLGTTLSRVDRANLFARWRHENDALALEVVSKVLGRLPKAGESVEKGALTAKLLELQATVKAALPISDALVHCGRLKQYLQARRNAERRLKEYAVTSAALGTLGSLGNLADEQVDQLRKKLAVDAAKWRSRIYLGAFPDTAHELVGAEMGRRGELDLLVQAGGVLAPAQHITNASALRASLVAFFLAFWEYVLNESGGIITLLLDDPQELLDDENRERLAAAVATLVKAGAQVILTSNDARFCGRVSRLRLAGGVEHLEVHPATRQQPVVRTNPPFPVIEQRKMRFDADRNAEEPARDFADGCRVFFEARLGDMFDDPAHLTWAIENPDPTLATFLQRLRPLVKAGPEGMFSAHVFRRFIDHQAVADGSRVLELMNKAHHGRRDEIRAADVAQCANDLMELLTLVEEMYEECYRWRRRDAPKDQAAVQPPSPLVAMARPALNIQVCPDLAAFTQAASSGESQDQPELLDNNLLAGKTTFFLRRPNFGFAAPAGSLALVEAMPGPAADRRLVIARHADAVYARRFLRGADTAVVGLTAEIPDPRNRSPKTIFLPSVEVAIHQVVGIIFDHGITVEQGRNEAVLVDAGNELQKIEIAFRVRDESAVPLALENQVVLGGRCVELNRLGDYQGALVALTLDDGSSIFKRVGAALPAELAHLRQFESIGGLGSSQVLSITKPHKGFPTVTNARLIVGVLYHG